MKHLLLLILIALSSISCKSMAVKSKFGYNRVKKGGVFSVPKWFVVRKRGSSKLMCSTIKRHNLIKVSKKFASLAKCLKKRNALNKHRLERQRIQRVKRLLRKNRRNRL